MGTTFYIILKGKVSVLVRIPVTDDTGKIIDFNLKEVSILGTGSSFGELAIIEDLKPRAATIIAKEPCHLAVLGRASYKKCLGIHQKKELDAKIEFLLSIPLFKSWSIHALMKFTYSITIKTYIMKQVIYKEDTPGDEIYIIRSGEVISTKNIEMNYSIEKAEEMLIDDKQQVYTYKKEPFSKLINIAVLSSGQIFGEEEAYDSYRKDKLLDKLTKENSKNVLINKKLTENILRQATMTCSSLRAEIWYLSKKSFFAKLEPYAGSFSTLILMVKKKAHWTEDRIKEIVKSATLNINYLVGNSPIKTRPSPNNDIITTIKYKHRWKNQAHTIIKSNPVDIESLNLGFENKIIDKSDSFIHKLLDTKNSIENNETSKMVLSTKQTEEHLYHQTNKKNNDINSKDDHKKIIIAENPNIKYWDLKLDTGVAIGTTAREGASKIRERLRSFKVKPIYHNPQALLNTAMLAKKKLQEKLQYTSFVNKESYTSIHEYNKVNSVSKMSDKIRDRPSTKNKERMDQTQSKIFQNKSSAETDDRLEEKRSLSRLVNILKSRSRLNKCEDDENSQIYNSFSIDKKHKNSQDKFSNTSTNLWNLDNKAGPIQSNATVIVSSFMNTQSSFDGNSNLKVRGEHINDFYDVKLKNFKISYRKKSPKHENFRFLSQSKDTIRKQSPSPLARSKLLERALTSNSKIRGRIIDFGTNKKVIRTPSVIIHSFNSYQENIYNKN